MTFSVGYSQAAGEPGSLVAAVRAYRDRIAEVYFAWPGDASGRAPLSEDAGARLWEDLQELRALGVDLHLLLNANCYGELALSEALVEYATGLVRRLCNAVGLTGITTCSPLLARAMRREFPALDVRASVNMRLGTVRALAYVARDFTSYCVQREYNRDRDRLAELQDWADANGKRLHLLANSGCLNFCAAQTFHDNVVAHEAAVNRHANVTGLTTLCRELYQDPDRRVAFLQGSWLRPEDLARHAECFHGRYKLATRTLERPRLVIEAYARGRHHGDLLALMEPGFGREFDPWIIDNARFPRDWFEVTSRCGQRCERCTYCAETLASVLVNLLHAPDSRRLAASVREGR